MLMGSHGFFDVFAKMKSRRALPPPGEASAAPGGRAKDVAPLSVSQLTAQIDRAIRTGFPNVGHVKGECSNYSQNSASGHRYFSMKDEFACLQCVLWRS